MSKKILVLMGGFSAERKVSLSSGQDIVDALKQKGYDAFAHDLTDVWKFIEVLKNEKPDAVFNGLYGNWGEDGEIQGLLDLLQIPYTHSGVKASCIGMDKAVTKMAAEACGIKTAKSEKMTAGSFLKNGTSIPFPYVVKPVCDGSSVGVYIVQNVEDIKKANDLGVICGVTTNPSLIAKEGRDFKEVIQEIASIVDGPISGEVKATTTDVDQSIIRRRHQGQCHFNLFSQSGTACSKSGCGLRIAVSWQIRRYFTAGD